jgi:hypothetical protein
MILFHPTFGGGAVVVMVLDHPLSVLVSVIEVLLVLELFVSYPLHLNYSIYWDICQ